MALGRRESRAAFWIRDGAGQAQRGPHRCATVGLCPRRQAGESHDSDCPRGSGRSCRGWAVTSLARTGGNVTGLTMTPSPEIAGKRLELLKEATGASRIAVLWNPARRYPYIELAQREVNASAQVLGIKLRVVEARGPDQFE